MKIIHLGLTKLLNSFVQQYSYGPEANLAGSSSLFIKALI